MKRCQEKTSNCHSERSEESQRPAEVRSLRSLRSVGMTVPRFFQRGSLKSYAREDN